MPLKFIDKHTHNGYASEPEKVSIGITKKCKRLKRKVAFKNWAISQTYTVHLVSIYQH